MHPCVIAKDTVARLGLRSPLGLTYERMPNELARHDIIEALSEFNELGMCDVSSAPFLLLEEGPSIRVRVQTLLPERREGQGLRGSGRIEGSDGEGRRERRAADLVDDQSCEVDPAGVAVTVFEPGFGALMTGSRPTIHHILRECRLFSCRCAILLRDPR